MRGVYVCDLSLQINNEFFQPFYTYVWKRDRLQHAKMSVFTNNIVCTCYNCTIYKLIVVRILFY